MIVTANILDQLCLGKHELDEGKNNKLVHSIYYIQYITCKADDMKLERFAVLAERCKSIEQTHTTVLITRFTN